jgi:hypothetical protein
MTTILREFTCTYSGETCDRPGCTRLKCVLELEDRGKAAALVAVNISSVTRPAWGGTIKEGRRYRLRNGAIVTIVLKTSYGWTSAATGKTETLHGWLGRVEGAAQRMTWQIDGWYAPECGVRPHELDIVATAP